MVCLKKQKIDYAAGSHRMTVSSYEISRGKRCRYRCFSFFWKI